MKTDMRKTYLNFIWVLPLCLALSGCEEDEYALPEAKTHFQNDAIKRSLGPNVVGLNLEFVYGMALGVDKGTIRSARVTASIPGDPGTYLEHRSFHTNLSGNDVPVTVADPSVSDGAVTEVTFTRDTCAAALRYYYIIPEAARGKSVEFTFSAKASTGEEVSYKMGPYQVAKMEMVRDITLTDTNLKYFSISEMKAYNAADAAANADKIDLVYLYRTITGVTFNHALVSPSTSADYLPGVTLPAGVSNTTKIHKTWQLNDRHLARLQYGIYVDDLDLEKIDVSSAPDYALNLRAESGAWVETADGKYRAYVYVNAVNNGAGGSMRISVKRLQMK